MKPGASARPVAITSRFALAAPRSPTATMRSPVTPTSPTLRGPPVPSKRVASRMMRSQRRAMVLDLHPVDLLRRGLGNQSIRHVSPHQRRVALLRVAHAAAARQLQQQALALRNDLEALGAQRRAVRVVQPDPAIRAVAAALAALRRVGHAVED